MRVQVLDEATVDLADGFRFYEHQAKGLGNFSATARMEQSFRNFERQFGGRVIIVYSVEDRIQNKEIIDQIEAEILRLRRNP